MSACRRKQSDRTVVTIDGHATVPKVDLGGEEQLARRRGGARETLFFKEHSLKAFAKPCGWHANDLASSLLPLLCCPCPCSSTLVAL